MSPLVDRGPPGPPSSVYVHVPYCTDRCTYCAFATVADRPREHERLVAALIAELERSTLPVALKTLYIGGGTPSLLSAELLGHLLEACRHQAGWSPDLELTLEANPGDVTPTRLREWAALGVSRLSLGVQTFDDDVLRSLGRHHDGARARSALSALAEGWVGSWSADLLVGWDGTTSERLERDVQTLLTYDPPHVSIYGLTLERGTTLFSTYQKHDKSVFTGDEMAFLDACWTAPLERAGYDRYEVSNFSRDGHRSAHNQVYWRNEGYLGLGPGASSSAHPLRWANIRDTSRYLEALETGRSVRALAERLSPFQRLLECLAVGLRTRDGLSCAALASRFGPAWRDALDDGLAPLLASGHLQLGTDDGRAGAGSPGEPQRLRIPARHLVRADGILRTLARGLPGPLGSPCISAGCRI